VLATIVIDLSEFVSLDGTLFMQRLPLEKGKTPAVINFEIGSVWVQDAGEKCVTYKESWLSVNDIAVWTGFLEQMKRLQLMRSLPQRVQTQRQAIVPQSIQLW